MTRGEEFAQQLATIRFKDVFNPYAEICPEHDRQDAAKIRRRNLSLVLDAALKIGTDSIWLGRDLGYRGGRRTGLALTDEVHLPSVREVYGVSEVKSATSTGPLAEQTAREVWKLVWRVKPVPFLWNVFPFHPHEAGAPMTNRRHKGRELSMCFDILETLLAWLKPKKLVALGNDAYNALTRLGRDPVSVRHPSYGGQRAFSDGIIILYDLRSIRQERLLP